MRTAARLLICLASFAAVCPAGATNLIEAWHAAQEHDAEFAAARAVHDAGAARRDEASALWRPSLVLTGGAGRMGAASEVSGARFSTPALGQSNGVAFDTSVNDGTSAQWNVAARQPLVNMERLAQGRALDKSADMADVQWRGAQQALMLRTAAAYFDCSLAQETLRVQRAQLAAAREALESAQERFRVGDAPVTDSHEALARAEAMRATVLASEADLQLKQDALAELTGIAPNALAPRLPGPETEGLAAGLAALDDWLARADADNPEIHALDAKADVAHQEAERFALASSATLDLVAQAGRDRLSGTGDYGPASTVTSNRMIGLQVSIPVFTGGYRSARHAEAASLAEEARAHALQLRRTVALQTRAAWLGLTVGAARIKSLAAALEASRLRLADTRLGVDVGDRTTLDLLAAQSDAAAAELELARARLVLLTERLKLAAFAGALDEAQLAAVDARLAPL